jgi:hypothetical protein
MTMTFEDAMIHLRALNHVYAQQHGLTPEEATASFSRTMDAAHVVTARCLVDINSEYPMTREQAEKLVSQAAFCYAYATEGDQLDAGEVGKRLAAAGMIATADMLVRAT